MQLEAFLLQKSMPETAQQSIQKLQGYKSKLTASQMVFDRVRCFSSNSIWLDGLGPCVGTGICQYWVWVPWLKALCGSLLTLAGHKMWLSGPSIDKSDMKKGFSCSDIFRGPIPFFKYHFILPIFIINFKSPNYEVYKHYSCNAIEYFVSCIKILMDPISETSNIYFTSLNWTRLWLYELKYEYYLDCTN